jgi:uncharacterized integral membrane protein (TIGR00698 family)
MNRESDMKATLAAPEPGARRITALLPGLALTLVLALIATRLGHVHWLQTNGISVLTLAIVLGMLVGNVAYASIGSAADHGITFSKQTLLRLGIVLYGLRLTFQDIAGVGVAGVAIDAIVLSTTFALSWWAGTRLLGLDRTTAMLIGAGSSICGAAAVMAAEPVVRARADQVTVAVATVVVFGTLAMFLYPALYHVIEHYHVMAASPTAYGIFAGSTIHEVAQVVVAGRAVSDAAANTAVITKMVRVMMLAPFLIVLSVYLARTHRSADASAHASRTASRIVIPWFAFGFVAVAGVNSLAILPRHVVTTAGTLDTFILAMAMAALGLSTRCSALRTAGIKPLGLAALLFAWLTFGGAAINGTANAAFHLAPASAGRSL